MHLTHSLATATLAAFLAAGLTTAASADPIAVAVTNPGFETTDIGPTDFDSSSEITGWGKFNSTRTGGATYIALIGDQYSGFPGSPGDGDQYLSTTQESEVVTAVYQNVGPIMGGFTYELTVDVGHPDFGGNTLSDFTIALYTTTESTPDWDDDDLNSNAAPLSEDGILAKFTKADLDTAPGHLEWQNISLTWDSLDPSVNGESLFIVLQGEHSTGTSRVLFDNVSLTMVPEPASLALLSLGGLAMLGRRRCA